MARPMESSAKRPRISIDVIPEVRRRLRLAAAKRDLTIRQYVLEAIEERLREDLGDENEGVIDTMALFVPPFPPGGDGVWHEQWSPQPSGLGSALM